MKLDADRLKTLPRVAQGNVLAALASLSAVAVFALAISQFGASGGMAPASLRDPIPFVFNTVQFVFNNDKFMKGAIQALQKASIVKFWLRTTPVYVLSELKNYQTIFSSRDLTYNGIMLQIGFPKLYRMSSDEIQRFANDKSGHKETPLLGTEGTPPEQRYWAPKYHVLNHFLSRPHHVKPIIDEFGRQFS